MDLDLKKMSNKFENIEQSINLIHKQRINLLDEREVDENLIIYGSYIWAYDLSIPYLYFHVLLKSNICGNYYLASVNKMENNVGFVKKVELLDNKRSKLFKIKLIGKDILHCKNSDLYDGILRDKIDSLELII